MTNHVLLITNPPHPKIDPHVAGDVLGIPPAEANLKARYGIPEIWSVDTNRSMIEADAAAMREAGMRCAVITGAQVAAVPSQQLVRSFAVTDQGITLRTDTDNRELSFAEPMIVVPVSPRAAEGAPPGIRITVAPSVTVSDVCPYLDVHLPDGNRFGIYAELLDAGQQEEFTQLADAMKERFTRAHFDDRLAGMQLRRPRQMLPGQLREARRGYSYASPGLDSLLSTMEPQLQFMSQAEWSARLAFLTTLSTLANS